jgi:N-acetylglucosamine-6-phosphate deacetylase
MSSGELHAFHFDTCRPVRVKWHDGIITELEEVAEPPKQAVWIAPPLVDLQINGYAGVDFQRDDVTLEELLHASRALRRDGCAHFLLTLITDEWSRLLVRLKQFRKLRDSSEELREAIIGWHIEGPFLSEKPGFHGAHNPAPMCDPMLENIHELRAVTSNDHLLLTMAPERNGALDAIRLATKLGMRVSLGHTDASAEILSQAVAAGATGFTHLANGCPRELDRHDNILWRVCETSGLTVSFIPDGHHVSPAPFRLLHKVLTGSIYYTTDAMPAAGAGPGRYRLGNLDLEVGADQVVRQPGKTNFAGSALTPIEGVFRAAKMLNCPWRECWKRFSEAPAKFIGVKNELSVGAKSFCVIDPMNRSVRVLPAS